MPGTTDSRRSTRRRPRCREDAYAGVVTAPAGWPEAQHLATVDLLLEPLRIDHAHEMAPLLDDRKLHVFTGGRPATREQLRDRYERQVRGRSHDGAQLWFNWILRDRRSRRVVGFVQATVSTHETTCVAEIAWVVGSAHQGRGYATQAARAMVEWLRECGADRIIAHVHPRHRASIAVATAIRLTAGDTTVDGEVRWIG